jgi:anti-sigma factor RsiW
VIHWKARRLLAAVLDHTLPAPREAAVRDHAERCPACARALAELQGAERLLLQLPASLLPRAASAADEARLSRLAGWARPGPPHWAERLGLQTVGALAGAALIALVITMGDWQPVVKEQQTYQSFASLMPGPSGLSGWR